MRKFREILSVGTMLPTLLLSNPGYSAPVGLDSAPPAARDALRLAQAEPVTEEELKRRQQRPADAPKVHPPQAPAAPQAPVAPRAQPPAPQQHVAPPAPREAAPPAPQQHVAPPAPQQHVAPPVPREVAPPAPPQHVAPPAPREVAPPAPQPHVAPPAAPQHVAPPAPQPQQRVTPPVSEPRVAPPAAPQHVTPPAPQPQAVPLQAPSRVAPPAAVAPSTAPIAPQPAAPAPMAPQGAPVPMAPQGTPSPMAPQGAGGAIHHRPDAGAPGQQPMPAPAAQPQPGAVQPPQPNGGPRPQAPSGDNRSGISPLGAAAVGAAVGVVGGMILGGQPALGLGDVQSHRRETREGDTMIYSEPGRVIVRDGDGLRLRHDETERFRELGSDVRTDRRGDEIFQVYDRPDGVRIITVTDPDGRLIRRIRRTPDGREVVLIDNGGERRVGRWGEERVIVDAPVYSGPRDAYVVDAGRVDERVIYDTLEAPPVAPLTRRYTLDEVRYNQNLRSYMRSVDVDTLTFATGSWAVEPAQYDRLATIAAGIQRALQRNPDEVFLVEGHTDAVGSDVDNLSLSDRRAQSVAAILTREFRVPAENLVTQGYGEQFLKVQTDGPSQENRRVTVRRITPLINNAGR